MPDGLFAPHPRDPVALRRSIGRDDRHGPKGDFKNNILLEAHCLSGKLFFFFQHWMEHANLKELIAIDLDASDNLTEELLGKFINNYGPQLKGRKKSLVFSFRNCEGNGFFLQVFACPA